MVTSLAFDAGEKLSGTVKFYDRHLVVCSGHHQWQSKIESGNRFINELTVALKSAELPDLARITACDAPSMGEDYDILLFPQGLKLIGVSMQDIPTVITMLQGASNTGLVTQVLEKPVWLICTHQARDMRCGEKGQEIYQHFDTSLRALNLRDEVDLWQSSHLGGHRFAGVMVCYPQGNWYGYVTPADVETIIDGELTGNIPARLWRGRMGMSPSEQIRLFDESEI